MRQFLCDDLKVINEWQEAHGLPAFKLENLSKFGLIIDDVCAGFIFETDGGFCVFDCFISNPKSSKIDRTLCLDVITEALLKRAEARGFKTVLALTSHPSIEERCKRYKFESALEYKFYLKEI